MKMRKWTAALLCLALMLGLCAVALGEEPEPDRVNEMVQKLLGNTADLSDEEIRGKFSEIAEKGGFAFTEKQLDSLVGICRSLEGLTEEELRERVELIGRNFYQRLMEAPEKFLGWLEAVENGDYTWKDAKSSLFGGIGKVADALSGFFGGVADYFSDKG